MFDRITSKTRKPKSRVAILFSLSLTAHVAVGLTLLIAGFWQIEKLMPPDRRVSLATPSAARMAEAPRPVDMERVKPPEVIKRVVKSVVQPVETPPEVENQTLVEYEGTGSTTDNGMTGISFGTGTGTGDLIGDPVGPPIPVVTTPPPPAPLKPLPPKVTDIPAHLLDGKRVSGDAYILPPDSVRVSMHRMDERRLDGMFKMCLNDGGQVTSLRILRSTGYQAYDQKILQSMRHWRYEPYRVDGTPVPVCAPIEYIYKVVD